MPRAKRKQAKINKVIATEHENKQIYVAPFLQQEIISEILSYLPVDSLLRFKCVCKLWYSIIKKPEFVRNHMKRAELVEFYGNSFDVVGEKEKFMWVNCRDGLVLEKSIVRNKYRILNPATRQVLCLPDPDNLFMSMCMFYVPAIQDYKVVYFNWEKGSADVGCQILTVANDLTWRSLTFPSLQNFRENYLQVFAVCDSDAFYLFRIVEAEFGDIELIRIDMTSECFSSVKIERGFFTDWNNVRPMNCNQKLSLAAILEEKLLVWVLEDYKENKWAERKIELPEMLMKDFSSASEQSLRMEIEGSWLIIDGNNQRLVYDIDCKKVVHPSSTPTGNNILGYIHYSAVHLKGMQPLQINEWSG